MRGQRPRTSPASSPAWDRGRSPACGSASLPHVTGLRVGIAAARAFAAGRGIPVHPVASHDAVAFGRATPTLVVTDARRREVAWTTYDAEGAITDGPHLAHPEDLETAVDGYAGFERVDAAEISAASLGLVAARLLSAGEPTGPDQPLYLRAPDVTMPGAPKRVTG
jgi:tRNA threonylcarbamoyl adenosine modification protein YeaZ